MTKPAAETGSPQEHVEARRVRVLEVVGTGSEPVGWGEIPLPADRIEHLVREAEDLYWNELAWEELTDEEQVAGGHLTELVFPGFLAFIDGLLLESTPKGVFEPPRPHPEVVEEILLFLARQYEKATVDLERGADSENLVWARAMTGQLIDFVLFKLYRLSPEEREQLEAGE